MTNRVGQQLGNYRLIRLLGQGGFAEVYLGEHIYLKSQAAIKVLYTRLAKEDMESFLSEARTLVHLIHPHIVRVLDFGLEADIPFLVMDFAPNGTLRQRHPKGARLPLSLVVSYVIQVANALQYAHNVKVIHRDIKPENMLIGRNNEILLSDFGIAIMAQSSRYSIAQEMAGTIAYMAPEQIQSRPRPASDQYALGIVVYEWLSGERPFSGSFTEIAAKQTLTPPPPLREKIPTIQPAVERILLTALEKDPSRRFPNVLAFANALEQASRGSGAYPPVPAPEDPFLSQSSPSTRVTNMPEETLQPTIIATPPGRSSLRPGSPTSTDEDSQPTAITTPSSQSSQQPERLTPVVPLMYTPIPPHQPYTPYGTSAQAIPSTGGTPVSHHGSPPQKRRFWSILVASLIVLLVLASFISWLAFSPRTPPHIGPGPDTTSIPTSTQASTPTDIPSPTAVQTVYPNMAGNYSGPIHNTFVNIYSTMTLSVNQSQGDISGEFTVASPLHGSGPFTGNIDTSNHFQFLVHSNETTAPILFWGTLQADNSLSGGYCSVNQNTQCDTNAGGYGVWSATPT